MTVPNSLAELAHLVAGRALDLARERPVADARHVRLRDAEHVVDPRRADPDRRSPRAPAIGFDEVTNGIRAVVEVEQRPLRALEQDALAVAERVVDEQRRVGDVRREALRVGLVARGDVLELERLVLVDALEPDVLLGERDLDLLAQDLRVEQVLDADPDPRRLVGVRGADAAPRRADLELAEPPLARAVDRDVPRHDQVRVARDRETAVGR